MSYETAGGYQLPEGYQLVDKDLGQIVATEEEAAAISRLIPLIPEEAPVRIFAFQGRIVLDYGDTTPPLSKISKNR